MRVDSLIQDVPTTLTAVPNISGTFNGVGLLLNNPTLAQVTVEVTDGNGVPIMPASPLPDGALVIIPLYLLPMAAGAKWIASAIGIKGQLWGYQ